MEHVDVIIVGAGQAGLAASHELSVAGVEHVVLERGRIGETWRRRWDTFCLVTPNWTVRLPGSPYSGPDPDGFMPRDEIVATLEDYAHSFGAPVRQGVVVAGVESPSAGGFILHTSEGDLGSRALVLATGAFQHARRPPVADSLSPDLFQIDVDAYRNERSLPAGSVLVIGSGQSGAQLSQELREAGRDVVLACGKAPWVPRRLGGHDIVWWMVQSGFMEQAVESVPMPAARLAANPLASGHHGGRDLNLRTLQAVGVTLTGHFLGVEGATAHFAADLEESAAWGDERCRELSNLLERFAAAESLDLPPFDMPEPLRARAPEALDVSDFGAVIFAGGFRPDYRSWLPWPDAFDEIGFPRHRDGESTVVPGLFFVGVHFLRKRKSALLMGVGEDATIVARRVDGFLRDEPAPREEGAAS
jgi:putative flavoprotein involved in K+ transport